MMMMLNCSEYLVLGFCKICFTLFHYFCSLQRKLCADDAVGLVKNLLPLILILETFIVFGHGADQNTEQQNTGSTRIRKDRPQLSAKVAQYGNFHDFGFLFQGPRLDVFDTCTKKNKFVNQHFSSTDNNCCALFVKIPIL